MVRCIWLACISSCLTTGVFAQEPGNQPIIFEQVFFERFVPQTALDMVSRVPGFTLDQGENRRGLAGAAGNVLIDGRSPVTKGQSLRGLLRQIPASTVERIELIRGAGTSASNAQTVLINVVRKPGGGSGVWRTSFDYTDDGRISPDADATWTGRLGDAEYRLSGDIRTMHDPRSGTETLFDADGMVEDTTHEERVRDSQSFGVSGEFTIPFGAGQVAFSGAFESDEEDVDEFSSFFTVDRMLDGFELIQSEQTADSREVSATLYQRVADWDTELSALWLSETLEETQTSVERDPTGRVTDRTLENQDTAEDESVIRAVAIREHANGSLTLEAEIAYNALEQFLQLSEEDDGGGLQPTDVPGADTIVDELRGEIGVTRALSLGPNWAVEAGVAYEQSRLTNEGDFPGERDLSYWKPSIQVTRQFGEDNQIRMRLFRDVDQLDFGDFAAGVELDNETILAGNSDLRPESSWRAEVSGDWRFDGGALNLTVYGWAVEDVQDFAIFETDTDRFDTRGNIGDGTIYGLRSRFETPIVWIPGSQVTLDGEWQTSEVTDPLTGETREQSGAQTQSIAIEFRQDVEAYAFAWGIDFDYDERAPQFRFDRLTETRDQERLRIWLETTAFANIKTTIRVDDLLGGTETRERQRFDPDRMGILDRFDEREREVGPTFTLRFQGSF